MPALEACGRVWEFGSDDLFFPGLSSVIIRTACLIGFLCGALYFRDALLCETDHYLAGLALTLMIIILLGILFEAAITITSARGTIINLRPRRFMKHLIYARIIVLSMEIILLIVGTAFAFIADDQMDDLDCPNLNFAITAMKVIVSVYWFTFIVFLVVAVIYMDPCHCYSAKVDYHQVSRRIRDGTVDEEVAEMQWRLVHTQWEKRFRVFCCASGSDDVHQLAYQEVAEIFAHLFCDTNVVMSDIVAGLVLLQKEHLVLEDEERRVRQRETSHSEDPNPNGASNRGEEDINREHEGISHDQVPAAATDRSEGSRLSFDFHCPEDRELFKNAMHFIKYALGMYSWPMYVYMNPFCGLCRLYNHLNCCCWRKNQASYVYDDDRFSCHLGGLRQVTGLSEIDIVCVSFENDVYKVPYLVCLDHEMKSVVVAFRGTLSFKDIITDFTASSKPIKVPNYPNFLVHTGMLRAVTSIIEKMDNEEILESAFNKVPGYKLVVVGHSLGSGCACIFSILMKQRFPDLHCFCYSPTGSLLNEAAAAFTEDFVTSITLAQDFVARLNVRNSHKLKDDLVRVIESCRKPKCRILLEGCLETLCTCFGGSVVFDPPVNPSRRANSPHSPDIVIPVDKASSEEEEIEEVDDDESNGLLISVNIDPEDSLVQQQLSHKRPSISPNGTENTPILRPQLSSLKLPVRSTRGARTSPTGSLTQEIERRLVSLYPPGRIIHIVDQSVNKPCFCDSRQLEVKWASRRQFTRISVSPDMVRDHFPDVLFRAMNKIWTCKITDLEDSEVEGRFTHT